MLKITPKLFHPDGIFPFQTRLPPLFQVPCVFVPSTGFTFRPLTLNEHLYVWDVIPTFSSTLSVSAHRSLLRYLQVPWKLLTGVVSLCDSCEC